MALKVTYMLPGGTPVPDVYFMINSPRRDKIEGSITFDLVGFKDQAARQAAAEAQSVFWAKQSAFAAARQALDALRPAGGETQEELLQLQADSVFARAAVDAANLEREAALQAVKAATSTFSIERRVTGATAADMLDESGEIDLSKVYAWVKATMWPEAEDLL